MNTKQPKLVLRESCIDDLSRDWPPGRFVEMGAGTGAMTKRFLDRGFSGACHDIGEDSRAMMRANLGRYAGRIEVVDDLGALPPRSFDYLFAFEVLEHIERDAEALAQWTGALKTGGRLLVSVPAHSRKYGRSDELVGHVRRYEKRELRSLLESAGFDGIRIVNYGFPVTELTRRFSNFLVRGDRSYDALNPEQRSVLSAQAKPRAINRWLRIFNAGALIQPFRIVQRWFYGADLGDGYVATATRR